jgi:hypothetical protein
MMRFLESLNPERDTLEMVVIRRTFRVQITKAGRKADLSRDLEGPLYQTYVAWSRRPL